jgi:hypothetical protein
VKRNRKKKSKSSRFPQSPSPSTSSRRVRVFPYIAIQPGQSRPALPIVIHGTKSRVAVRALVDSGADYSILPKGYASYLGVDLDAAEELPSTTAGGSGVVLVHPLPLEAEVQAMSIRFAMKSAFTERGNTVLLGREDFFQEFRVTFDEPAQTFTLEKL